MKRRFRKRLEIKTESCSTCGKSEPEVTFRFRSKRGYYATKCIQCESRLHHNYYKANAQHVLERTNNNRRKRLARDPAYRERIRTQQRANRPKHLDTIRRANAIWRRNHPKYGYIGIKRWRRKNPEKVRLHSLIYGNRRRAAELHAIPPWVNHSELENIYKNCPPGYDVDHIYPLQGKISCGLHVPWNLQYLTISENRRKHNKLPEEFVATSIN